MYDFADGWVHEHRLSQVLTGALFDIWVDIFHEMLLERRLISSELEDLSDQLEGDPEYQAVIQPLFDRAFSEQPEGFAGALFESRDYMGFALANIWKELQIETLDFADVYETFMEVDHAMTGGRYHRIIKTNMLRRGIGVISAGPRLSPPDEKSHTFSARTAVPMEGGSCRCRHLPYSLRHADAARNK